MTAHARRIIIDDWESSKASVDPAEESWLDKPVSSWPDGTLFPVNGRGVYANTLMNNNEAKVSLALAIVALTNFLYYRSHLPPTPMEH